MPCLLWGTSLPSLLPFSWLAQEEDEFAEESASLPQAREALASFTDQKEAALNDLAALEAEMVS